MERSKGLLDLEISVVDIKLMKTEGKLPLRKSKELLDLEISVVHVKLMKTEGKLRLRKSKRTDRHSDTINKGL